MRTLAVSELSLFTYGTGWDAYPTPSSIQNTYIYIYNSMHSEPRAPDPLRPPAGLMGTGTGVLDPSLKPNNECHDSETLGSALQCAWKESNVARDPN